MSYKIPPMVMILCPNCGQQAPVYPPHFANDEGEITDYELNLENCGVCGKPFAYNVEYFPKVTAVFQLVGPIHPGPKAQAGVDGFPVEEEKF